MSGDQIKMTHLDEQGKARMVEVTDKQDTKREAVARGFIHLSAVVLNLIRKNEVKKGDPLETARLAGIMAAKRTHELIPLCHPLLLTDINVDITPNEAESALDITGTVRTTGKTGVEMEALTAVSIAALTVYDMCKAVDRGMRVESVRLAEKRGGKSGEIVLE